MGAPSSPGPPNSRPTLHLQLFGGWNATFLLGFRPIFRCDFFVSRRGINLDLLVWWLDKNDKTIPQMLVVHGDESHGIEFVKHHQLNKHKKTSFEHVKSQSFAEF